MLRGTEGNVCCFCEEMESVKDEYNLLLEDSEKRNRELEQRNRKLLRERNDARLEVEVNITIGNQSYCYTFCFS